MAYVLLALGHSYFTITTINVANIIISERASKVVILITSSASAKEMSQTCAGLIISIH